MSTDVRNSWIFILEMLKMEWYGKDCEPEKLAIDCYGNPVRVYGDLFKAYEAIGYKYSVSTDRGEYLEAEKRYSSDIAVLVDYPEYTYTDGGGLGRGFNVRFEIDLFIREASARDRVDVIRSLEETILHRLKNMNKFVFEIDGERHTVLNPWIAGDKSDIEVNVLHSTLSSPIINRKITFEGFVKDCSAPFECGVEPVCVRLELDELCK